MPQRLESAAIHVLQQTTSNTSSAEAVVLEQDVVNRTDSCDPKMDTNGLVTNPIKEESVTVKEYQLTNADGCKLFCKRWTPKAGKPKAIVIVLHGYAEHCLYYEELALSLAKEKVVVAAHDHVGHGQSEGTRVHVTNVATYVRDVFLHTDQLKEEYSELPMFLVSHSMGGTIGIKAGFIKPQYFRGYVLIAPCVVLDPEMATPFKKILAKMLGRIYPQFPVSPLDYDSVTRDVDNKRRITEDPLRYHGYAKAGWAVAMLDALEEIEKNMDSVSWPFLILHGKADKICAVQGSELLHERSLSTDKTMKVYPDAYHSLLLEPDGIAEEAKRDTIEWILERTG